jgi:hypothetical protein
MGYIEDTTLLAFKPFLYNIRRHTLHPHTLPDYVWPSRRVITSPCRWHTEPEQHCTCGVHSTLDLEVVQQYVSCKIDTGIRELIPVMGVIQALGKTIQTDLQLRSWGAYLWGLVKPVYMHEDRFEDDVIVELWGPFKPVVYYGLRDAVGDVRKTTRQYRIKED